MEPTGRSQLAHGVYAALATPRRKNLAQPDTAALLDYLDAVARGGVDGLVLFGATGEFIHFDIAERMLALNLAAKRSRLPILVNISHSTMDGTVALAEDAIDRGVSGILVLAPYFYRYGDSDLEEFFLRFVKTIAGRIPIYLYNLPQFGSGLPVQLAVRLLATGQFAGIKDSSGDWDFFDSLRTAHEGGPFQLLAGHERLYLRGRLAGGVDGIVSGVAAALPELMAGLARSISAEDIERAQRLDGYMQEYLSKIAQFPTPIGIKQTAVLRRWPLDHFACPLSAETSAELQHFRAWLAEWMPRVLEDAGHR